MAKDKKSKGEKKSKVSDGFVKPSEAGSGGDDWKLADEDHLGELFILTPTRIEKDVKTAFGTADEVIVTDVVHVNRKKPAKSEAHEDVFIFQAWLRGSLRSSVGTARVLGVLAQGEAKKGQSAPWVLENASDADEAAAKEYLESLNTFAKAKG